MDSLPLHVPVTFRVLLTYPRTLGLLLLLEALLLERVCIRIFSKGRNGFKVRDQVGFR